MNLPSELISQFAKITKDDKPKNESTTVYGTIEEKDGSKYVRLDGSSVLTPISTTVEMQAGERVTVMIKNHEAVVTGNITSPAARGVALEELADTTSKDITNLNNRTETSAVIDLIYPVGSIYISASSADPGVVFGHGKWERIKDRFLLSAGDTYTAGTVGGEASHRLTIDEMPEHYHEDVYLPNSAGARHLTSSPPTGGSSGYFNLSSTYGSNGTASMTYFRTGSEGGYNAHNNMPPYLAVYVWKRTA